MALIQANFMSKCLMRTVTVNVILPVDKFTLPGQPVREKKPFKTLYLLHGIFGDHNDWITGTRIARWAQEQNLAVVMPAGENHFYVDDTRAGHYFSKFIGEELVQMTRDMFPLSTKREDTFIGGLSMGGYGAMRNGLVYHDTFSKICAFSGAYIIFRIIDAGGKPYTDEVSGPAFQKRVFGNFRTLKKRGLDPRDLVLKLKKSSGQIPEIFMTIGTDDFLLDLNRAMRDTLVKAEVPFTYIEDEGIHDWAFWNKHMEDAFAWLAGEK